MSLSSHPPSLPTEPIGSIPRPPQLIAAWHALGSGGVGPDEFSRIVDEAVADTLRAFEATGSPVVSDGEQAKVHNFASYCVEGLPNVANDGFRLKFVSHERIWPRLTAGPLRFAHRAADDLRRAQAMTRLPLKQALIAPSAVSLFYPDRDLGDYPRERFVTDLIDEHVADLRACLRLGAHTVQVDFTEGRLACKLDRSGSLLKGFVGLNNAALERFTPAQRERIGVHTCAGGDRDSTHSADVDYADFLPALFELKAGRFFVALARERDPDHVLSMIARLMRPGQHVYVGVVDPLDPEVESPETVRDRVLHAADHLPVERLGTTDDCGFSPFCDDRSTTREVAFAKIASRVAGTAMAARRLARRLHPVPGRSAGTAAAAR